MRESDFNKIIGNVTNAIVGVFDIAELQKRIVWVSQEIFEAEACSLFLVEDDNTSLRMVAGSGYAKKFIGAKAAFVTPDKVVKTPRDNRDKLGLTSWIASTGRAFMANSAADLQNHPHWSGKYDKMQLGSRRRGVQNFYGVPLSIAPGKVVGVLKVEGKRKDGEYKSFTRQDARIFEILAAHVAVAISNARQVEVIERSREQLQTTTDALHRVVGSLSKELPMEYLLHQIVATTMEVLHAGACALFLRDEEQHDLLIERAGKGYAEQLIGRAQYQLIPNNQLVELPTRKEERVGLTAWIAITGQPFLARSNEELRAHPHWRGKYDPEHYPSGSGAQCESFLGLPLRVGEEVLGVLKVENKRIGDQYVPFTDQDRQVFEMLAQSIAIAIGAVREQRLLMEQRITSAMYRVSQALVGRFEISPLLEEIVKTGKNIFGAESCVVFLIDERNKNRLVETKGEGYAKQLEDIAEYQLVPREQLIEYPTRKEDRVGLTAWIAITGRSFLARSNEELREHPHWRGQYDAEHYPPGSGSKCESFLGLPLRVGEEILGVLKVENKKNNEGEYVPFDERDQQIFGFLVNGASIAIRNARDLRRLQETRQLEAIGRSAAAMAHRMGTPLQNIRNAAQLIKRDLETREQATEQNIHDLEVIEDQLDQMNYGIQRVREAVKTLSPQLALHDLHKLLEKSLADFSTRLESRQIQSVLIGLDKIQTPILLADEGLLREAFSYLIENSLEAIHDHGHIQINVEESERSLILEFSDDGPGIPEEIIIGGEKAPREKLFEPFVTTKRGGWGLGLFLVRRNIEAHAGKIFFVNKSQGACFHIELPLNPEQKVSHAKA